MTDGLALAAAAERLAGSRFRLHGRDPDTGLDCIGLLAAALAAIGRSVSFPTGYSVRTSRFAQLGALASAHGFAPAGDPLMPGDVLFVRPGPAQMHLIIAGTRAGRLVEAHAGLGRVVVHSGALRDPVLHRWRLMPLEQG